MLSGGTSPSNPPLRGDSQSQAGYDWPEFGRCAAASRGVQVPAFFSDRTLTRRTVFKGAAGAAGAAGMATVYGNGTSGAQSVPGLPAGTALITSPRLPL